MINLFFSTMMSENGFLLVSGPERYKITIHDERQGTVTLTLKQSGSDLQERYKACNNYNLKQSAMRSLRRET